MATGQPGAKAVVWAIAACEASSRRTFPDSSSNASTLARRKRRGEAYE
jgi:hypothetical protein